MNHDFLNALEGDFEYVDLTHPLRVGMPVWPGHPPFEQRRLSSLESGDVSCLHALCLSEHTGTHFDAPLHFVRGGKSIAEVPVRRFFGRLATIDACDQAPDSEVVVGRVLNFEAEHGLLRTGDAVMFSFGWPAFGRTRKTVIVASRIGRGCRAKRASFSFSAVFEWSAPIVCRLIASAARRFPPTTRCSAPMS
jgi:kynurenine formamidase